MVSITYRPIQAWPRELTRHRRSSNFSTRWNDTLALLDRELRALGASRVVIQLALREEDFRVTDGHPRANATASHPGVIIAFESRHGPLQYATDTFTSFQDNVRAVALGLEALRKVDRYGITKRGEQYTGWKALPPGAIAVPPSKMTADEAARFIAEHAHADYGLTVEGAVEELLSGAWLNDFYRAAAKRLHPDREGGSTALFQRLQEARALLEPAAPSPVEDPR